MHSLRFWPASRRTGSATYTQMHDVDRVTRSELTKPMSLSSARPSTDPSMRFSAAMRNCSSPPGFHSVDFAHRGSQIAFLPKLGADEMVPGQNEAAFVLPRPYPSYPSTTTACTRGWYGTTSPGFPQAWPVCSLRPSWAPRFRPHRAAHPDLMAIGVFSSVVSHFQVRRSRSAAVRSCATACCSPCRLLGQ